MPEIGNPSSLLALEEKPNSFVPIDLETLGLEFPCSNLTLRDIDCYTRIYNEDTIRSAIKKANIVSSVAIESPLVILYEENGQKRKTVVIFKEAFDSFTLYDMISDNIFNKTFINQIITKIRVLKVLEVLKYNLETSLKSGKIDDFMQTFNCLDYIVQRKLYLYTMGIILNKDKTMRIREKNKNEVE